MAAELFEMILDFYRNWGYNVVPVWDIEDGEAVDMGFRRKMANDFDYGGAVSALLRGAEAGMICRYEDDLCLNYSFYRMPEELEESLHCRVLSIGPFLFKPLIPDSFEDFMDEKGIDPIYRQDFLEFFNSIPLVYSMDSWNQALAFFLGRLCGQVPGICQSYQIQEFSFLIGPISIDYSSPRQPDVALSSIAERYGLENKMLEEVAAGNSAEAYQAYRRMQQYRLLPRVADPVRNQKNLMFTFNTLLRKGAEMGNVHPFHLDALSRQIAIEIESCLSLGQLERLNSAMIRKYCLLVKNYSRRSCSNLIRECLNYIDFNYDSELSLSVLADVCSVTKSYLSALFKRETGSTVTDYINSVRVRQALILLNSSSLPIGEVAARCGFPDSNYFSRIFKKQLGLSPREYQNEIRRRA